MSTRNSRPGLIVIIFYTGGPLEVLTAAIIRATEAESSCETSDIFYTAQHSRRQSSSGHSLLDHRRSEDILE
jgi:hypothetical protein